MKTNLICALIATMGLVSASQATPLPKITPDLISEVQRVCVTLDLATFPIRQGDMKRELDLPPYEFGLGVGGGGKPMYYTCPISDRNDPLGYYALRIYFGDYKQNPEDIPVTQIEVAYVPKPTSDYPPFGALIYITEGDKAIVERMKAAMKASHLTAAEYVRRTYAEIRLRRKAIQTPNNSPEPTPGAVH